MNKVMTAAALVGFAMVLSAQPSTAQAQSVDHQVQRAWDNVFNPPPPGDPRTNWERRRDAENYRAEEERRAERDRYVDRRADEHAAWCSYHPGAPDCAPAYRRRY